CRQVPLLLVGLARPALLERRPDWGRGWATATRLALEPLSAAESERLVGEILRHIEALPPRLPDLIVRGAAGNPFYVEELIKVLIEDGVIVPGATAWTVREERLAGLRVPVTLTAVLQARLDALPPAENVTGTRSP